MSEAAFNVAVVGGGVAGLYAAWRLLQDGHDPATLAVFEQSDRSGGRLWSVALHQESTLPAELGGMFFNDQQPHVYGLCRRVFALDMESVSPQPDFAWLRARRFRIEQFADPAVLPYHLAPDEQGLSYCALLGLATDRIAPELRRLWPRQAGGSREETIAYLRQHRFDDRLLHEWGFWNLLARVISNEAWLALRDIISSYTVFNNWNGYDAMISLVVEQSGNWFRLTRGYQHLPDRLAEDLRTAGVALHLGHPIQVIERRGEGFLMVAAEGRERVAAEHLILALPRFALDTLVAQSPCLQHSGLSRQLDAVRAVPACKIFLTFDEPWWRDVPEGPGQIGSGSYAVSHTDLPLRQCYYLGIDVVTGKGLMLASYADGEAVDFWQALMPDAGRDQQLCSALGLQAREEIRRQLSSMHGVEVPRPTDGLFINWTRAPFGGGWHNWQPGWKSWETTVAMRRPIADARLHVCGEAYSKAQGWTEGALASTEAMVQQEFGLQPPEWLRSA